MYQLTNIKEVKKLMEKHGVVFKKNLGQNFIIDRHVCPNMVEKSGITEEYLAIEIGTGVGVLTKELAKKAKKVVAIELDKTLIPLLGDSLQEFNNVKIIQGDILKLDLKKIIEEEKENLKVCVCANLPYYITSPILMKLLEEEIPVEFITAMVQKEVAERLVAPVGTREGSAITVGVNFYSTPKFLMKVSKGCFLPSPKVDSGVIQLNIGKKYNLTKEEEKRYFQIVRGCFSQRRKTILNSLCSAMKLEKEKLEILLTELGISPKKRPEELGLEEFYQITKRLEDKKEAKV